MSFRKTTIVTLVLLVLFNISFAQLKAISAIDTVDLKRHLSYIASDHMQGRCLGTEIDGLGLTARYLAKSAEILGLLPGAPKYFQTFELASNRNNNTDVIEVRNSNDKLIYRSTNLIALRNDRNIKELDNAQVCFVGFGNKLGDIEIQNKIVCVAQGNVSGYSNGADYRWENELEQQKFDAIARENPEAIFLITNPKDRKNQTFSKIRAWFANDRYRIKTKEKEERVPVFVVLPEFADKILGSRYQKYLDRVAENEVSEMQNVSGIKLSLKTGNNKNAVTVQNVIGVVEGSDPELKKECVVFMAHYDHVGVNKKGEILNGADDNGSGTVALLEVAEAFARLEEKPARSLVFLWITCEENGLLGSKYYTNHPLFQLDKTIACINLDMVGRVYEPRDSVYNRSPKKVKDFNGLYTLSNDVWPVLSQINAAKCAEFNLEPDTTLPSYFLRSSDHYHFHKNNVPILNYATGYHADFHKPGDDVSKINFEKLKLVSQLTFSIGLEIANYRKQISINR